VHNNVGVNLADATNAADNQCTHTLSGLSTEIKVPGLALQYPTILIYVKILKKYKPSIAKV
jgi:hypothetical protein